MPCNPLEDLRAKQALKDHWFGTPAHMDAIQEAALTLRRTSLGMKHITDPNDPWLKQGGILPTEASKRKSVPLYRGLVRYFPDALIAVADLSQRANEQHNPGEPLHWAREKSRDQEDALLRHLFEIGSTDTDGVRHAAKVAWRALAILQLEIEKDRNDNEARKAVFKAEF